MMTDQMGQPQGTDNVTPVTPVAAPQIDQGQVATAAPTPTDGQVSDKYAGKTPEELSRILRDQESHIGRLGNEVGTLRQQAEFWQNLAAQGQQPVAAPQQPPAYPPQQADNGQSFDWDNPTKTIEGAVEKKLGPVLQQFRIQQASTLAQFAEAKARQEAPHLFQGQENEVKAMIVQGVRTGLINPDFAANPEMWKLAANSLRAMRSGYAPQSNVNAVMPTSTEMPKGNRPPQGYVEPPALDDTAKAMLRQIGRDEAWAVKKLSESPEPGD